MTKSEREHYAKLARLGCILCRCNGIAETDTEVEIHHIRRYGQKRSLSPAVPLCAYHHRLGDASYHSLGAKGFQKYWGISPEQLVEMTNDLLQEKS